MLARGSLAQLTARAAARGAPTAPARALSGLLSLDSDFPDAPALSPAAPVAAAPAVSTLPSGLKVVSTTAGGPVATVGVHVAVGSREETAGLRGAAFLLKHLAFKHTLARSDLRMQRALDDLGATTHVALARESLTYSVTCLPACADEALAAVAETVSSPRFVPWIVKEAAGSKLVKAELDAFAKDAEAQAMQALHEAAFGAESPLGAAPVCGPGALTAAQLEGFAGCLFSPASMVVVGAGVPHDALVAAASVGFAGLAPRDAKPTRAASPYVGGEVRVKADAPLVHVALGGAAPADAAVAAVLKALLGGFCHLYDGAGVVGVYGTAAPAEGGALAASLAAALKGAAGASDAAVGLAKTKAKFAAAGLHPDVAAMGAATLATGAYAGPPLAAIDGVTTAAVKAAAAAAAKAPSMASLGDLSAVPRLAALGL